jgi:predicted dehydrogenase/nucleoside-diphosphate-sugar epimerase
MSMKKLKIGFLGAGYILHAHAKAVAAIPGLHLHAVCDLSRTRAERAAAAFGIGNACGSIEELLALGCDAVHVLLPPQLHADASRRLLEAGVHVLLEKPMALNVAQCEELAELAERKQLRLGVGHNFLFLPGYERLRQAARSGNLGRIDQVGVDWLCALPQLKFGPFDNWMLREPGNLMLEIGPHLAAFALDLVGEPSELRAWAARPIDLPGGSRAYRRWTVAGESEGGCFTLGLSLLPGEPLRRVTVRGLSGVASFDYLRDILSIDRVADSNAAIANLRHGLGAARGCAAQTFANARKSLVGTLRKTPLLDPYRESIYRCVQAFHADMAAPLDVRLSAAFGIQVVRLCERSIQQSGVLEGQRRGAAMPSVPHAPCGPAALVVGGTGFIGKRLVRELLARGSAVRVLTRSVAAATAELGGLDVELVQGSHGDKAAVAQALRGIDVVYHLAKATGERWDDYVHNDIGPTSTLAEAALEAGVRRFVYTGTIDSYASADANATIDSDTLLDERIDQRNLYARSKAACEELLMRLHRERGLPLVIVRPGIVIGEGAPPAHWGVGMFHSEAKVELWGDGRHPLPFVLVADVASALALAGQKPGIEGQAFLVTDDPLLSARDYIAEVQGRSRTRLDVSESSAWRHFMRDLGKQGLKQAIRHPNRRQASLHDWACRSHRSRYDNRKTRERLGWQPAGSRERLVREGVHAAVDWYLR